jgi:hypothetical protein
MRPGRQVVLLMLVLCSTLLLTACPRRDTVGQLLADPSRYQHQDVTLTGTVTESFGALGTGAYALDDGTGTIWVIARRAVPSRGTRVGVTGRLRTGVTLGERSFGTVIVESDRSVP